MKHYLNNFIKIQIEQESIKSDKAYQFILQICQEYIEQDGKISDKIKLRLQGLTPEALDIENILLDENDAPIIVGNTEHNINITLESIQIKHFKGFGGYDGDDQGCNIQLHKERTIIFAPNGGGKSSFCEALEWKLTEKIREAERRGFKNDQLHSYYQHHYNNSSLPEVTVTPTIEAKDYWRDCFIEKNRIQSFALLGLAKNEEKDVIATLLGLEELDRLTGSESFVLPPSFNLDSLKRTQIAQRMKDLDSEHLKNIGLNTSKSEDLQKHLSRIKTILGTDYSEESYKEKIDNLNQQTKQLEAEISRQIPKLYEHKQEDSLKPIQGLQDLLEITEQIISKLQEDKAAVNFKELYNLIIALEPSASDKCPACDTPLTEVTRNPFEKSREELDKLANITQLEEQRDKQIKGILAIHNNNILPFLKQCKENIEQHNIQDVNDLKARIQSLASLPTFEDSDRKNLREICVFALEKRGFSNYFNSLNTIAEQIRNSQSSLVGKQQEFGAAKEQLGGLKTLETDIKSLQNDLKNIEKELKAYNETKEELARKQTEETKFNQFLDDVEKAYKQFHKDLQDFRVATEAQEFAGIESKVLRYYQAINKHDSDSEAIQRIDFTKEKENYRIHLMLKNDNAARNAFTILSEGHLRGLGLAVMLALAEKRNTRFLIFDDVVNAIDSDHRANIIDMLCTDNYLQTTQIIITTHDRLFWERFCYQVSANNYRGYIFDYDLEYGGIHHKEYDGKFEKKIEIALQHYDIRQALIYSRIWFETMVTNYCLENKMTIKGKFSQGDKQKNNLVKLSLEQMYQEVKKKITDEEIRTIFQQVYQNTNPTWQGINEANHSIDDSSLNFSHSRTSREVQDIFENLQYLSLYLTRPTQEKLQKDIDCLGKSLCDIEEQLTNSHVPTNISNIAEANKKKYAKKLEQLKKIQTIYYSSTDAIILSPSTTADSPD